MLEETIKVGKKNIVVIPSKIRKKVGIREGDLLKIKVEGDKILLEKLSSEPFKVLADVIGEPYIEEVDEVKAEKWLRNVRD
ncbi:AbrB family transcriptional regulator [Archaeoglobales archaeon]|nr:MAG: AbrB family transcriptional regulator [Archaeoglobales archaeon]